MIHKDLFKFIVKYFTRKPTMAARVIPTVTKRWTVSKMTNNFREACKLGSVPLAKLGPKDVLVKNRYVGINASDINVSAGRYRASPTDPEPYDIGFEGVAEVVQTGTDCRRIKSGQAVGHMVMGAYSEYQVISEDSALELPEVKPEYTALLMTGIGPAIGLDTVGNIKKGDTVYITAAAGGTGHIAVQYAKACGCNVIGTTSTEEKGKFLKSIGCDRVINYKTENVHNVLQTEYPKGINVGFENVGGEVLCHAVHNIAFGGKVILYGFVSAYEKADMSMDAFPNLAALILRCASLTGFFFATRPDLFNDYIHRLVTLQKAGKIKTHIDDGSNSPGGAFKGLEDVPRAIDYMYSGKNVGKIVLTV